VIAWACAVGPGAIEDAERVIAMAREAVNGQRLTNRLNTLGATLFRAGRYPEALQALDAAVAVHGAGGTPYDALFLAMTHHQLGHREAAADWLRKAAVPFPATLRKPDALGPSSWIPRLELTLLLNEARALLATSP
jgi:tetratricopeptide (TPR) repeat protein